MLNSLGKKKCMIKKKKVESCRNTINLQVWPSSTISASWPNVKHGKQAVTRAERFSKNSSINIWVLILFDKLLRRDAHS